MKRFVTIMLCMTISFTLVACRNTNAQEEEAVSVEKVINEMTEEEINKFATGVSVVDVPLVEENGKVNEPVILDDKIEEKCPYQAYATRPNVNYGKFEHKTYYSSFCDMERGYNILLPGGYCEEESYPVLYLLHGIFGNEHSLSSDSQNKIKEIVGNFEDDGVLEKTIVVLPNMYAAKDPSMQPAFNQEAVKPYDDFLYELTECLMPHIEETYSVKTGRENTYLAGFSMGGRETIYISNRCPEKFGYVCAIAPAPGVTPGKDGFMEHPGCMEESELKYAEGVLRPEILIICCGTKDSVVGLFPMSYHNIMVNNEVDHIWYEIDGADHDNNAIKSGLYNLLKQIAYNKNAE